MLLSNLVKELKMSCNGCYLHAIVNDIPLQLLDTLLRASDSVNQRHPDLKNYIIHKVTAQALHCLMSKPSSARLN